MADTIDISSVNSSQFRVTRNGDSSTARTYNKSGFSSFFQKQDAPTTIIIEFNDTIRETNMTVLLSNLTVGGVAPADFIEAETALSLVFLEEGSGSTTLYVEKTKTEIDSIIAAFNAGTGEGLPLGVTIKITGTTAQSGLALTGIFFIANEPNIVPKVAQGLFLDADYRGVGDYSGIAEDPTSIYPYYDVDNGDTAIALLSNIKKEKNIFYVYNGSAWVNQSAGKWSVDLVPSLVAGMVTAHEGKNYLVYQDPTGVTNPPTEGAPYSILWANDSYGGDPNLSNPIPRSDYGYVQSLDPIIYDHPNDWLEYRYQKGKVWGNVFGGAGRPITDIEWGNDEQEMYFVEWDKPFFGTIDLSAVDYNIKKAGVYNIIDAGSGAVINFPAPTAFAGQHITVINFSSGAVNFGSNQPLDVTNGAAFTSISANAIVQIYCTGTNWVIDK